MITGGLLTAVPAVSPDLTEAGPSNVAVLFDVAGVQPAAIKAAAPALTSTKRSVLPTGA